MRIILFLCLCLNSSGAPAQTLYYVHQNAGGGSQTGTSWADAFPDLQQALAVVNYGDTVWVAAGIYVPTATTDRTVSFVLVDGVKLYGGFAGTETELTQRNIELNHTILSGEIGTPGERTDNVYHVVRGKGLGEETLLDGFYIRNGYSYTDFTPIPLDRYGAGLLLEGADGVLDSRPNIHNCFFENNQAQEGGAICITWSDFGNPAQGQNLVNPVIRNCTFSRNLASRFGGALYKNGPSGIDSFLLEDCLFLDNKAFSGKGGGIYFNSSAGSNVVMRRCLFERDSAFGDAGGGIAFAGTPPDSSIAGLVLDSCVFRGNVALEGGGLFYDGFSNPGIGNSFYCQIRNCRFEENLARSTNGSAYYILFHNEGLLSIEIENCLFQGNLALDITTLIDVSQNAESNLYVNRSIFANNIDKNGPDRLCMAINHGGGLNNIVNTEITNCLFYGNGGGVASTSGARNYSTTQIVNCTFFDNNEYIFVKTWDTLFNQPNGYFNDFFIDNCIVWEPNTDLRKMFYNNKPFTINMTGYRVNNTLLNLKDSVSVPGAEQAFQLGNIWGSFPGFQDSLAGDFRLLACSPAVNKGNNQVVINNNLDTDLDGLSRIRYGRVDLGAYEQQDSCLIISTNEPSANLPLTVWPNPSTNNFIQFALPIEDQREGQLQVFNVQGQLVIQKEMQVAAQNYLNLESLHAGFYTIRLEFSGGIFTGKWVRL